MATELRDKATRYGSYGIAAGEVQQIDRLHGCLGQVEQSDPHAWLTLVQLSSCLIADPNKFTSDSRRKVLTLTH